MPKLLSLSSFKSQRQQRQFCRLLSVTTAACILVILGQDANAQDAVTADEDASALTQESDADIKERFDAFADQMSGSKFVGNFTVIGQDNSDLTPEEYHIAEVKKLDQPDMWLFTARIKYGERDVSLPIQLEVRWAGDDTPVITVTDFKMFGYGPFSSRVVIYNGKYAGTWSHGDVGGHLFGEIKKGEAEGVDVEKSMAEMKAKLDEKAKEESKEDSKESDKD